MDDFLYLFRGGEGRSLSPEEIQKNMQKWGAWIQELSKAGVFKGGQPLDGGGKVVAGSKKLVTDGPFAESKEVVNGYLIVSAKTLAEAAELAKGCPIFETAGTVEIRQIRAVMM